MNQEPQLTIDEPFELSSSDLEEEPLAIDLLPSRRTVPPGSLNMTVAGPNGNELVDLSWCNEPTRIMSKEQTQALLEEVRESQRLEQHLMQGIHTRPTVRSMQAVVPPSRPCTEVEVVDSQGRKVEADQWR